MTPRIHVLPATTDNDEGAGNGEWALTIEGMDGRDSSDGEGAGTAPHFPTQETAIAAGWLRARQDGVPLCLLGRDGMVRERKIYCREMRDIGAGASVTH